MLKNMILAGLQEILHDPLRAFVALHVPGIDGTFLDTTGTKTVTNHKNRASVTGVGRFGGTALLCPPSTYAGFPVSPIPVLGGNDFCIETQVDCVAGQNGDIFAFVNSNTGTYKPMFYLTQNGTNRSLELGCRVVGSVVNQINHVTANNVLNVGYNHVAVVGQRNATNTVITLYVNGVAIYTFNNLQLFSGQPWTAFNIMGIEYLGGIGASNARYGLNSSVCDFRITIGNSRYNENFTPPNAYFPTI